MTTYVFRFFLHGKRVFVIERGALLILLRGHSTPNFVFFSMFCCQKTQLGFAWTAQINKLYTVVDSYLLCTSLTEKNKQVNQTLLPILYIIVVTHHNNLSVAEAIGGLYVKSVRTMTAIGRDNKNNSVSGCIVYIIII